MKISYRVAAIASAATIMATGMIGVIAAAPAQAVTEFKICLVHSSICLYSEGYGNQVRAQSTGALTNFEESYTTTFQGNPAFEFQQVGTTNCLEFDLTGGDIVRMDSCVAGRQSQIWESTSDGSLVNEYATGQFGQQACMDDPNNFIYVSDCSSAPNHEWHLG